MVKSKRSRKPTFPQKTKRPPQSEGTEILLDKFSGLDLISWRKLGSKIEAFHNDLYFCLEAQRTTHLEEIKEALKNQCGKTYEFKQWSRIVDYRYCLSPLSSKGSLQDIGGRFNYGQRINLTIFHPFPALYLGQDYEISFQEKFGIIKNNKSQELKLNEFALANKSSFANVLINGCINNTFELNKKGLEDFVKIIKKFSIPKGLLKTAEEIGLKSFKAVTTTNMLINSIMDSNWRHYPKQYGIPSNSQILGNLLKSIGCEAIIYPSSKGFGKCMAIFIDNFHGSESYIELSDEAPDKNVVTRLDGTNFLLI